MFRTILTALFLLTGLNRAMAADMTMGNAILGPLKIQGAVMPAPPGPARNAVIYMVVKNSGSSADRLVKVTTDIAKMAMIHQTIIENNISKMRPVMGGLEVPARGQVELAPNSYHIMVMGLHKHPKAGEQVKVTFGFKQAGEVTLMIPVVKPGDMKMDMGGSMN